MKLEKLKGRFDWCVTHLAMKRGIKLQDARDIVEGFFEYLEEVKDDSLWEYSMVLLFRVGILDAHTLEEMR